MSQITDEILSNIDIVDIVSKYVPLKRAGANFTACCPFHNEKTPSFMVSPGKQIFKCFGCGKGGNVITFVQEIERIDFRDTVKELAKTANIDMTKYQSEKFNDQAYADGKEKIKRIHKLAQQFFVDELKNSVIATTYLKEERKLDQETIDNFGIGYAPDSHYSLLQYLRGKGFSDADMIEASLAKKWQTGEAYGFFKHRITFPIYDLMNNVVGFSARVINPQDKPKYLNSSEHKAFEKSKLLYWLNIVKQHIKQYNSIIIVEGQMDVIALHRLGMPIGVATCWTALTNEHLKLIKRYTENVYLLFDNDDAGQEATLRALNVAYQNSIFPKKITLPAPYKDCDDVANVENGRDILQQSMQEAKDWFVATFERLKQTKDFSSPIDKHKILNLMFGLIQNINNVSLQQHYVQTMADLMHSQFEVTYQQYRKFSTDEGRYSAPRKKVEASYQIDRSMLAAALFYDNFIDQFIENRDLWTPIKDLVQLIVQYMPESTFAQIQNTTDEETKTSIAEMQLRRDKELGEWADEKKRYQTVKSALSQILQTNLQLLLKNKSLSGEQKSQLLALRKGIE